MRNRPLGVKSLSRAPSRTWIGGIFLIVDLPSNFSNNALGSFGMNSHMARGRRGDMRPVGLLSGVNLPRQQRARHDRT